MTKIRFSTDKPCAGKISYQLTISRHIFHSKCLEEWLKKHENCPLCRKNLTKEEFETFESQMKFSDVNEQVKNNDKNTLLKTDKENQQLQQIQIDAVDGHDSV
jgi:hypothetical protein